MEDPALEAAVLVNSASLYATTIGLSHSRPESRGGIDPALGMSVPRTSDHVFAYAGAGVMKWERAKTTDPIIGMGHPVLVRAARKVFSSYFEVEKWQTDPIFSGFPGDMAATLSKWPLTKRHPELDQENPFITTLLEQHLRDNIQKGYWADKTYSILCPHLVDASSRFVELSTAWQEETAFCSDSDKITSNFHYLQIIGMGPFALPFIFEDLKSNGSHWFVALAAITGADPVPSEDKGVIPKMIYHWLTWAKENGYNTH